MDSINRKSSSFFCLILFSLLSITGFTQTAGNLTFSCLTDAPNGSWGTKHVLAIWIEDTKSTPTKFIKTKAKYGNEDDHLTSWVAKSGKNLVDAVTGATLTSYTERSVIWDGTDINGTVVEDGTYRVLIEMGWGRDKTEQHSVLPFTFTKGENTVELTPAGNSYYSNVSVKWEPTVTLVNNFDNKNTVSVFPNPSKGKVYLNFKHNIHSARIIVENEAGISVYKNNLDNDFTGLLNIDLEPFPNGLYFIRILSTDSKYTYKVVLNK